LTPTNGQHRRNHCRACQNLFSGPEKKIPRALYIGSGREKEDAGIFFQPLCGLSPCHDRFFSHVIASDVPSYASLDYLFTGALLGIPRAHFWAHLLDGGLNSLSPLMKRFSGNLGGPLPGGWLVNLDGFLVPWIPQTG